jgi:hypothetical protein
MERTTKMKISTFIAVTGVLCALSSAAQAGADLTINGDTGLVMNPSAHMPAPGGVRVQGGYYILGDNFGGEFSTYALHAATRLKSTPLEINGGISRLDVTEEFSPGSTGDLEGTGIDIGIKYLLRGDDDPDGLKIAIGAGYSQAFFQNRRLYAVASKPVGHFLRGRPPVTLHLGLRHDRYKSNDETSNRASIYGGVEIPIDRSGTFTFIGELQSPNHDFSVSKPHTSQLYSYALRVRPRGKKYSTTFGIHRQGVLSDSSLFASFGCDF